MASAIREGVGGAVVERWKEGRGVVVVRGVGVFERGGW